MPPIGPYSRPAALAKLDGRTRESRLLESTRKELVAHVGGSPSATQRALIERCAMLSLHLALMDEKALTNSGRMTELDSRTYLAWSNTLARTMKILGMKGNATKPPSLSDYIGAGEAP